MPRHEPVEIRCAMFLLGLLFAARAGSLTNATAAADPVGDFRVVGFAESGTALAFAADPEQPAVGAVLDAFLVRGATVPLSGAPWVVFVGPVPGPDGLPSERTGVVSITRCHGDLPLVLDSWGWQLLIGARPARKAAEVRGRVTRRTDPGDEHGSIEITGYSGLADALRGRDPTVPTAAIVSGGSMRFDQTTWFVVERVEGTERTLLSIHRCHSDLDLTLGSWGLQALWVPTVPPDPSAGVPGGVER